MHPAGRAPPSLPFAAIPPARYTYDDVDTHHDAAARIHTDDSHHLLFAPDSLDLPQHTDPRKTPLNPAAHLRTALAAQQFQVFRTPIHEAAPRHSFPPTHQQLHLDPQASLRLPAQQLLSNRSLYAYPRQASRSTDDHRQITPHHDDRLPRRLLLPGHAVYPPDATTPPTLDRHPPSRSLNDQQLPQHTPRLPRPPPAASPSAAGSTAWGPLVARAREHSDFWAVLRSSTLAHQWAIRGFADGGEPTRGPALARGAMSMYVCDGCTGSRSVLRRQADMLFPIRGGSGVVVGHYVELIMTADEPGSRVRRGRYVLCGRSRELFKLRPADEGAALAISRAVALGDGAVLRDFVEVVLARDANPTLPDVVASRTSVLHIGARASADAPPFIPLDLDDNAAAALAIDPSAGISGLGEHPMALVHLDPGAAPQPPLANGTWAPPRHCATCARPKWVLQKLERNDAVHLRRHFHAPIVRSPPMPQCRIAKRPHSAPPPRLDTTAHVTPAPPEGGARPTHSAPPPRHSHYPPSAPLAALHVPIGRISLTDDPTAADTALAPPARSDSTAPPLCKRASPPPVTARDDIDVAPRRRRRRSDTDKPPPGTPLFAAGTRSRPAPVPLAPAGAASPRSLPTVAGRVRKKVEALPEPSPSDVVMRNRISAQRSNEKRRKQHHLVKMEVAYHHDRTIPTLKMRQMLLLRENEQLRSSFATKYIGMAYCSYYGSAA